jgi:hypothetical protein
VKPSTPESSIQVTSKLQDSTNNTSIYSLDGRTHLITKTFSGSPFVVINNYDGTTAGINLPPNFNGPFLFPFAMGIAGATSSGDGKTLNLDFTTGALPFGITFNRGTVGTYLDSDGFVKYAPHNLFKDTVRWATGGAPWNAFGTVANYSKNGDLLTINSTATQEFIWQSIPRIKGLPMSISVEIVSISNPANTLTPLDIILDRAQSANTSDTTRWYLNGNEISSSSVVTTPGVISKVYYPDTTSNGTISMGLGCSQARTGSITLRQPQYEYGAVPNRKYVPNTSTTLEYHGPRFEYSAGATALGILVEPRSRNFLKYSSNFSNTNGWNVVDNLVTGGWPGGALGTGYTGNGFNSLAGQTAPDGGYAYNLIPNTTSTTHFIKSAVNALTAGFSYAFSAFVKPRGYTGVALVVDTSAAQAAFDLAGLTFRNYLKSNARNTSITPYPNGWYRVSMPFTAVTAALHSCFIGPINSITSTPTGYSWSGDAGGTYGVLAWGAQLEPGFDTASAVYSSATSLIPAGDTNISRNKDSLTVYGITSAMNWNQSAGTLLVNMDIAAESNTTGFVPGIEFATDDANGYRWRIVFNNGSAGTNPRIFSDIFNRTTPTPVGVLTSTLLTRPTGLLGVTGFKFAVSQAQSNAGQTLTISLNGSSAVAGFTSGSTMGTPIRLQFNIDGANVDQDYFPAHFKNVSYWPYAITGTTLQNLTRP